MVGSDSRSAGEEDKPPTVVQLKVWKALEQRLDADLKVQGSKPHTTSSPGLSFTKEHKEAVPEDIGLRLFRKVKSGRPVVIPQPFLATAYATGKPQVAQQWRRGRRCREDGDSSDEDQVMARAQRVAVEADLILRNAAKAADTAVRHIVPISVVEGDSDDERPTAAHRQHELMHQHMQHEQATDGLPKKKKGRRGKSERARDKAAKSAAACAEAVAAEPSVNEKQRPAVCS